VFFGRGSAEYCDNGIGQVRVEHTMKLKTSESGQQPMASLRSGCRVREARGAWGTAPLWIPEAVGREVFSAAAWLLAGTNSLIVASGIANIYARDSFSAAAAQKVSTSNLAEGFSSGWASRTSLWWRAYATYIWQACRHHARVPASHGQRPL